MEKITLLDIKTKKCSKCGEIKELGEFYKYVRGIGGVRSDCKKCNIKQSIAYQKRNYEKVKVVSKIWSQNNKEKLKEQGRHRHIGNKKENNEISRMWAKNNPEKANENAKRWAKNNPKKVSECKAIYYKNNCERLKEKSKQYRLNNSEKVKEGKAKYYKNHPEKRREYERLKKENNFHYKIKHNVSTLILVRLKLRLLSKEGKSTFDFLPYTIDDLIKHLESQFEPWMNWQNYGSGDGRWSIDHRIPDSSFNYESVKDEEFQKCWALDNLQPLDWMENIKKSNKIIY